MSYRVRYNQLSDEEKTQIKTDLTLHEPQTKYQYANWKGRNNPKKGKEIVFYSVDEGSDAEPSIDRANGPYILLPMFYASRLFRRAHINRSRVFPQIEPFHMTAPPRDYQQEVIDLSLRNFMAHGSTFLNVFCSYGKTYVAAFLSALFSHSDQLLTLVTYPGGTVAESWEGTFKNRTTAKLYVVGESSGEIPSDVQVILCMDTRLMKIPLSIRRKVGHLVVDEADCYCTPGRVEGLLSTEPMYVTLLTATYERDDGMQIMLDLLAGSKEYITNSGMVLDGPERITRISRKPFFVFQRPTPFRPDPKQGDYGVVYDSLLAELDKMTERNSMIIETVLDNLDQKILILTYHVDHAEKLHAWLSHYLQPLGKNVSLLAKNIKTYSDAPVMVATLKKAGRGFDEEQKCVDWNGERFNMLILASSTMKIEQVAGRVFRADVPLIIDFVDDHKNLKKHWGIRRKWYESRNGLVYSMNTRFRWVEHKDKLVQDFMRTPALPAPVDQKPEGPTYQGSNDVGRSHLASVLNSLNGTM